MSQDIRSFFTKSPRAPTSKNDSKPSKVKKRHVISSDEEDDVKIFDKKVDKSSKKTTKTHFLSDSDDDSPPKNKKTLPSKKEPKKEPKAVSISDMIKKTPVKRVNAPKASLNNSNHQTEGDVHDDDHDFEEALEQLDTTEIEAKFFKEKSKESNGSGKRKKNETSEDDITPKKPKLDKEEKKIDKKSSEVQENPKKLKFDAVKKGTKPKIEINPEEKKSKKKASEEESDFLEDRAMKKKQSSVMYAAYLARGGARNPGSKEIPEGAPNCLAGLSFVLTGVFDSLEREEAGDLIKKYGGRVTAGISKKIDYIVVGDEAGQSKLAKAESLKIKQLSEDQLLDLIREKPSGNSRDIIHNRSRKKEKSPERVSPAKTEENKRIPEKTSPKLIINEDKSPKDSQKPTKTSPKSSTESKEPKKTSPKSFTDSKDPKKPSDSLYFTEEKALVEKYRPKSMKQIIGQHGDSSNAKKLYNWISNWHKNRGSNVKLTKPSPWAKNDGGAFFKACLLSGPPGVGKTTTVQVVCSELGFDLLEFNASDTRSKRLLKEEVSSLLSNTTMKGYFTGDAEEKPTAKHVLLMDEVDGMAGNEDRGGLQELISLIKSTDIPIICICNDRNHPKMRTLANYVFDLRFQKPKIEQIRGAMKSLCCKENIKISNEDLDRLIEATNYDIRQVINHLSMLIGDPHKGDQSSKLNKDLKLGPWDVVRKVFSAEEHKNMSIHDKSDLFFHDYNIAGLFVQENYLSVMPKTGKVGLLERVADSADSLSLGDQVEKAIRGSMAWSLLPMQACYSSVIPGSLMSGNITSQISFPSWLGKNSRRGKFDRLLQEITAHTRLVTGASKEAVNMEYLKPLRNAITGPLAEGAEGVEKALEIMNHYHLLREDLDSLVEVSLWPGDRDPMQAVESKVKAAFTRAYNKSSAPVPFVVKTTVSKKRGQGVQDDGFVDDEEVEEDEEEDDSIDVDKMVKAKKPSASKATASTSKGTAKPASKRGRGRGK